MAIYEVELNGKVYEAEADSPEKAIAAVRKEFGGQQTSGALRYVSNANQGLVNTLGMPVDAVNSALGIIGLSSEKPIGGSEWLKEKLQNNRVGVERGEGFWGKAAEYAGGSLPFAPIGAASAGLPGLARGTAREVTASFGAAAGSEAAENVAPGSTAAQLVGTAVGGMTPGLTAAGFRRSLSGNREKYRQSIADAQEAGIDLTVGQTTGAGPVKTFESLLESVPGGHGPLLRAAERTQRQFGERLRSIQDGRVTPYRAGIEVNRGLFGEGGWLGRFKSTSESLFNRIKFSKDAPVPVANTSQRFADLSKNIEGYEGLFGSVNGQKIAGMRKAFDEAIDANGAIPFGVLKAYRSSVGRLLSSSELVSQAPRGELKSLYAAISEDMRAALANDPKALRDFNRANSYYRSGISRVDDFIESINRKTNNADVFKMLKQGNYANVELLRTVKKSINKDEWAFVQRAALEDIATARPSAQDATGNLFSSERFLTNWNSIPDASKNVLFSGQMRKDLDQLARVADDIRSSAKVLANPSGTAGRGLTAAVLFSFFSSIGSPAAGALSLAKATVISNLSARAMTNPKFVRWLAKGTELPIEALPGHLLRLDAALGDDPDMLAFGAEYTAEIERSLQQARGKIKR